MGGDSLDLLNQTATPAIIVVAYNRPKSLARLLNSLSKADYPGATAVPLVISIDGGGDLGDEVGRIAHDFVWEFGEKEIVAHGDNLGLIGHVFVCGDLSDRFGAIVLLEDDLMVGKAFYRYAQQAAGFYRSDPNIAGISLSALWFHGFTQLPFTPYLDGGDSFFMQIAWYQGQVYTAEQWDKFRAWLAQDEGGQTTLPYMHPMFSQFPATDWFPLKTRYLVETGRFYAFPRESVAVNFGEMGTHFAKQTPFFQVPLQEHQHRWNFYSLADCLAVYDSWQEMLPSRLKRLLPELAEVDFETDFYGERGLNRVQAEFLLTTQPSDKPVRSWGLVMRPPVANLIHDVGGGEICLVRPDGVKTGGVTRLIADWKRWAYFSRYRPMGRWRRVQLWVGRWLNRRL